MSRSQPIDCAIHGTHPWQGEVMCTSCNRVWKLNGTHEPPPECGKACVCGAMLVDEGESKGTARAICPRCYARLRIAPELVLS